MIDMIGRSLARFGCIAVIHQKLGSEYTRGARVSGFVVAVVVAVGGLSLEARDMAAPDVAGNFPVNSNLCILDLSSSNSSHKVDGAVVDTVDSVPSAARGVSTLSCICMSADRETSGEELYVRGVEYDRFDCRYEVPRAGFVWSGIEGRRPP